MSEEEELRIHAELRELLERNLLHNALRAGKHRAKNKCLSMPNPASGEPFTFFTLTLAGLRYVEGRSQYQERTTG